MGTIGVGGGGVYVGGNAGGRLAYSGGWNAAEEWLSKLGHVIFVGSIVFFACSQHFTYAGCIATLVTPWIPGHLFWVYLTGVGMIAAGLCIAVKKLGGLAATWLAIMFLSWVIVLHGPRVAAHLRNGDEQFACGFSDGRGFIHRGAELVPGE